MKLRTQRVHLMGSSNRVGQDHSFSRTATGQDVFERSFIKSNSVYYKTTHSLPPAPAQTKTDLPFKGTHSQLQTLRWNSTRKRIGSENGWKLDQPVPPLDNSARLNEEAKHIVSQFEGKEINMYKLNQLKKTFIKNNSGKHDLNEYFKKYARNGVVGTQQLQGIVKEYGYDVSEDEAKLMIRLTGSSDDKLPIGKFVELMTRDNVHYGTLKINGSFGQPRKHFTQRIHLIFKNKFNKLKEAFRIHTMRQQQVDEDRFHSIMKKLDINDLIISRAERQHMYDRFSQDGFLNVEAMLGAIIEQDMTKRPTFPPKLSEFDNNLRCMEEANDQQQRRPHKYDFKRISNDQYQRQLTKAQRVLEELRKKGGDQLVEERGGNLSRQELRKGVEEFLQAKGINFHPEQYDCFAAYLDYNNDQKINQQQFSSFLRQNEKQAMQRFERRKRVPPPQEEHTQECDETAAFESLNRVKAKQLGTQMKVVFRQFDKDKDGFVSKSEMKSKLGELGVLQDWEISNLAEYFDPNGKGFVTFSDFAQQYTRGDKEPDNFTSSPLKGKSQSDWISNKQSQITQANTYYHQVPTKYSAWPQRLHRHDLSMIQPPNKAGTFIGEDKRFNSSQKHSIGQQVKLQKNRIYENRIKKLAAWNDLNRQRILSKTMIQERRAQANDYSMRIAKEKYEQNCHKGVL